MTGASRGGAQAGMLSLLCEQSSGALSAFPREQTVTSDSDQASPVCHLQEALLTPFTDEETEAQEDDLIWFWWWFMILTTVFFLL